MINYLPLLEIRQSKANRCPVMTDLQNQEIHELEPQNKNSCTLMLLTNLAEPQWISVPCSAALLPVALCVIDKAETKKSKQNIENANDIYFCPKTLIMINKTCYNFLWGSVTHR